jgi:hypothetical protein
MKHAEAGGAARRRNSQTDPRLASTSTVQTPPAVAPSRWLRVPETHTVHRRWRVIAHWIKVHRWVQCAGLVGRLHHRRVHTAERRLRHRRVNRSGLRRRWRSRSVALCVRDCQMLVRHSHRRVNGTLLRQCPLYRRVQPGRRRNNLGRWKRDSRGGTRQHGGLAVASAAALAVVVVPFVEGVGEGDNAVGLPAVGAHQLVRHAARLPVGDEVRDRHGGRRGVHVAQDA